MSEVISTLTGLASTLRTKSEMPETSGAKVRCEDVYIPHPLFPLIEAALRKMKTIFIFGLPGCGKSEIFAQVCAKNGWKFDRFPLNGDMSKEDIFGSWVAKDGATFFVDGIVPRAMKEGILLCLEELDAAPPEVLFSLQMCLEKHSDGSYKPLYNPMNGETITAAKGFGFCATANTNGKGDTTSLMAGTHPLNEAFLDRFNVVERFGYPEAETEVEILRRQTGIDKGTAGKIVQLANAVREALTHQKVYCTFSMRRTRNLAQMLKEGMVLSLALRWAVVGRVNEDDARSILEMAGRIFGTAAVSG